jgi:hypothetical protein
MCAILISLPREKNNDCNEQSPRALSFCLDPTTIQEHIVKQQIKEKAQKIRIHFHENKRTYLACAGTAVVTVVGTLLVMSRRPDVNCLINSQPLLNYKPNTRNKVIFKIEALGDPGNVVHDLTTGDYYPSQNAAARALDIPPPRVSQHLKGKSPHAGGHKLEIVGKAGEVEVHAPSR